MLSATLIKFLPRGAHNFWYTEGCAEDWYTNLLYYNNYQKDRCLGQSWYLAVEMQCFIITPVLILLMYWKPVVGNIFTGYNIPSIYSSIKSNKLFLPVLKVLANYSTDVVHLYREAF